MTVSSTMTFANAWCDDLFGFGMLFSSDATKAANIYFPIIIQFGDCTVEKAAYLSGSSAYSTKTLSDTTYELMSFKVSGNVDSTAPTLTITSPKAKTTVTSASTNVIAQVTDGCVLDGVWCYATNSSKLAGSESFLEMECGSSNTNLWSASVSLTPGTNYIFVRAFDQAGNVTTKSNMVYYQRTSPITISTTGKGIVKGATNGQVLDVGKTYTLTAVPSAGQALSKWGLSIGTNASTSGGLSTITFVMQEDLSLAVDFVPNPYPVLKGNYAGVFQDTATVINPTNNGSFSISVTTNGACSGSLKSLGKTYSFTGQLQLQSAIHTNGNWVTNACANFTVKGPTGSNWLGSIQFDFADTNTVTGSLTASGTSAFTASINGVRLLSQSTNFKGTYNIILPAVSTNNGSTNPVGTSYGTLTIGAAGTATLALYFADKIGVTTIGTYVGVDGLIPVYAPLYSNKGQAIGWLRLDGTTVTNEAVLTWFKASGADKTYYPKGFTQTLSPIGALWTTPKKTSDVIDWTSGSLRIQTSAGQTFKTGMTFDGSKFTFTQGNILTLSISFNATSGKLSGSFSASGIKKSTFAGIYVPKLGAQGFYLETNSGGMVFMGGD